MFFMILILLFFQHEVEFIFYVFIDIDYEEFESVPLIELIWQWSCFLESFSNSIVELFESDVSSLW